MLVVFAAETYDLAQLLIGVNSRSDGAPLIGCSTAGEIAASGPCDASVVVVALGGEGFSAKTALAENATARIADTTSRLKDGLLFMNSFLHEDR